MKLGCYFLAYIILYLTLILLVLTGFEGTCKSPISVYRDNLENAHLWYWKHGYLTLWSNINKNIIMQVHFYTFNNRKSSVFNFISNHFDIMWQLHILLASRDGLEREKTIMLMLDLMVLKRGFILFLVYMLIVCQIKELDCCFYFVFIFIF